MHFALHITFGRGAGLRREDLLPRDRLLLLRELELRLFVAMDRILPERLSLSQLR